MRSPQHGPPSWTRLYYALKPAIPRSLRLVCRRQLARIQQARSREAWPIFEDASSRPPDWDGWPDGKRFALVLTHDVETDAGLRSCLQLRDLERRLGFRSAFYFVPEKYRIPVTLRHELVETGYEIGVHGLTHDGKLYASKEEFNRRARRINGYLREWKAVGFRSPLMHHNLEWIHDLNVEYDASTFDTDPFEPQPDGVHTIFPFHVPGRGDAPGYIELPYTLPQDSTVFNVLGESGLDIWKTKLRWIARKGGMALLITHPDYMAFQGEAKMYDQYPAERYEEFLEHIVAEYCGAYWNVLPREIAAFWRKRVPGREPQE